MSDAWKTILEEAAAWDGREPVVARAYSEFMPPPYVALKPCAPQELFYPALDGSGFAVSEYEEAHELFPGLAKIARHVFDQLGHVVAGRPHELSHALLADNAAWPESLAARRAALQDAPLTLAMSLALSRTQDDKGNVRWSLFGASHLGPGRAFWRSFPSGDEARFARTVGFLAGIEAASVEALRQAGLRVLPRASERGLPSFDEGPLPSFVKPLLWATGESPRTLLTFESFGRIPAGLQEAFFAGKLAIVPTPPSLVFFEHQGYRRLAGGMPWALQIGLLQLFPRSESSYDLRIPQSGWLDEHPTGERRVGGHRMARTIARSHRFEHVERDAALRVDAFADPVTQVLFSIDPDKLGLYGKPMGRNAQIWTSAYEPLLHGPGASREDLARAAKAVHGGGRFGYRFFFPPMRAGARSLFWHRPLVARLDQKTGAVELAADLPLGFVTAERDGEGALEFVPRLLDRPGHREAARSFARDPGHRRRTTCSNLRKIFEWSQMLGGTLPPSMALRLLDVAKNTSLETWIEALPEHATEKSAGERCVASVRQGIGLPLSLDLDADGAPRSRILSQTRARTFEEKLWQNIASLAEGEYRDKDNADVVSANEGRTGGKRAAVLGRAPARQRDLDKLGDWLHRAYQKKITRTSMTGRAFVADQRFRWETDFDFEWSRGWAKNREQAAERNVVVVIPGKNEREAVVMADHYDTAYMEDLYDTERGGDQLRASAQGADDNHSATSALLAAADLLLPLSREGKLERSVWLVHLTGEEFPSDCLGARALARALESGKLELEKPDQTRVDVGGVRVRGVCVLDMIGHNNEHEKDVFQIAAGEGEGSARLALLAHLACERWNRLVPLWNRGPERHGRGPAQRMKTGVTCPPIAEHLALRGEVRTEWEPRSALYNTDGQIFSDVGVPVVLFMENYDISRSGYHDTHDTMKNIDLDYCAALTSIAIETVAEAAMGP